MGINRKEVTPGWLYEITKGQFGEKSKFPDFTGRIKSTFFEAYYLCSKLKCLKIFKGCASQFTTGDHSDSFERLADVN